jgi:hypothetical protein
VIVQVARDPVAIHAQHHPLLVRTSVGEFERDDCVVGEPWWRSPVRRW